MCFQRFGLIYAFPRQIDVRTSKMTVGCGLAINRTAKIQHTNDARRTKIEILANELHQFFFRYFACSVSIDINGYRVSDADRISQLDFHFVGQPRGNEVFRHVTRRISGRTVNFGRVFPRECAAAVAGISAVRIDNNFAAR
ncbi:hypothetical protein DJ90_6225 [Paenibacillus macerans]|uniref:Uncharacterized protein n=1 Tax=Paenibacillus macerans TaxID=44252 RepID=A0A090XSK3_PAEMA|nr:hypothetical protein DJ90_6225 [Paenibacillus macerans]